jgi:hypothetical protein
VTGHFFPAEVAMTLVVALCVHRGIVACFRRRTDFRLMQASGIFLSSPA